MMLTLTDIRKHFGATRALDGVTLAIRPGRVHALVGENGAG
jgi:ABC-type sugar transport system ATPase subunit